MKLTTILIQLFLTLLCLNAYSQLQCVTQVYETQIKQHNRTKAKRAILDLSIFNSIVTVPVTVHIIRNANSNGGLSLADLNTSISNLNNAYQDANMDFKVTDTIYIDNDTYHYEMNFSQNPGGLEYKMAKNKINNTLNIYFVRNPKAFGNEVYGWSSFPSDWIEYKKDWIVIKNELAPNNSTLAHEVGHYFSLYHTHRNEIDELPDGSNCGQVDVGDELCDTPADPNLTDNVNENCQYTGNPAYQPDVNNIMSYSKDHCRNKFSKEQIERLQQSYIYDRRSFSTDCLFDASVYSGRERDSLVLMYLYNTANGHNWPIQWDLTQPLGGNGWFGVNFAEINNELRIQYLGLNGIQGYLPCQIQNLTFLDGFGMIVSTITEPLPEEFTKLSNLKAIIIRDCTTIGGLPRNIGNLTNLGYIEIFRASLRGYIPDSFYDLNKLYYVDLSDNNLTGSISAKINNLSMLSTLLIDNNNFKGQLPASLSQMDKLEHLNVSNNNFSGCYDFRLDEVCTITNNNSDISIGNNFEVSWEDFCNNGDGECSFVPGVDSVIVYPGDFNDDKIVNYNDYFTYKSAKNFTGYTRNNASFDWTPQIAKTWNKQSDGVNLAHQDGNGDGIVDSLDLEAFELNYWKTAPGYQTINLLSKPSFVYYIDGRLDIIGDNFVYNVRADNTINEATTFSGRIEFKASFEDAYIEIGNTDFEPVFFKYNKDNGILDFIVEINDENNTSADGVLFRVVVVAVVDSPIDGPGIYNSFSIVGSSLNANGDIFDSDTANEDPTDGGAFYCNDNLNVAEKASFSLYQGKQITSNAKVENNTVLFEAIDTITLNIGFEVPDSLNFEAKIEACE